MTFTLQSLIRSASTELGSAACSEGRHQWQSEGGRGCPVDSCEESCGQAVYVCVTCGTYDYGEPGGPGYADCMATRDCEHKDRLAAKEAAVAEIFAGPTPEEWAALDAARAEFYKG